jgi:hypothetical protein
MTPHEGSAQLYGVTMTRLPGHPATPYSLLHGGFA